MVKQKQKKRLEKKKLFLLGIGAILTRANNMVQQKQKKKLFLLGIGAILTIALLGCYAYLKIFSDDITWVHYKKHTQSSFSKPSKLQKKLEQQELWIDLKKIDAATDITVPAIAYTRIPNIFPQIGNSKKLKNTFTSIMLPLVLIANQEAMERHKFISAVNRKQQNSKKLSKFETKIIDRLAKRYLCKDKKVKCLLYRVQPIPVPLAIGQAAIESGYGRSRFANEGNALYGQWASKNTPLNKTIVAKGSRGGTEIRLQAFDTLLDSVRSYMVNLNSHKAYENFRSDRAKYLEGTISFKILLEKLNSYAEKKDYAEILTQIIIGNNLHHLQRASLHAK